MVGILFGCYNNTMIKIFSAIILLFSISAYSSDLIKEKAKEAVSIKYKFDCDNLVDSIRHDSRMRMTSGISLEQINNRVTKNISKKNVDCVGIAFYSDSTKMKIKYGGKIDENNEWVFYYYKD